MSPFQMVQLISKENSLDWDIDYHLRHEDDLIDILSKLYKVMFIPSLYENKIWSSNTKNNL